MNNKGILIASFLLANLSGCAYIPSNVDLKYQPQQGVLHVPEANKVTVKVEVNDSRQDKNRVGNKTNAFGWKFAHIGTTEDVAVTIRSAIEQELQDRGFHLGTDATVNITADLTKFYSDLKVGLVVGGYETDLNMNVTIKSKKGALLYSKQLVANGSESDVELVLVGSDANLKSSLGKAMSNAMKTLFNDKAFIAALMASTASN